MYSLTVENEKGELLELTNNRNFDVLDVSGTSPPTAAINTAEIVGIDGAIFNSSRVQTRNIVITLNIHHPIEVNRLTLYRFFKVKRWVKIYYKNSHRDVYIEGYVETFENNLWSQLQQPQISIICPQPFWLAVDETMIDFQKSDSLFEFPFSIPEAGIEFSTISKSSTSIVNVGDIETGGIIRFHATTNQILNPIFYNRTMQTYFGIDFDMYQGDIITVNTMQGEKSVTLLRNGVTTSLLSSRKSGSTWVQFEPGENEIAYGSDEGSGNLNCSLTLVRKYEGV